MVTKTVAKPTTKFTDAPKREDMQNYRQLYRPGAPDALWDHLEKIEDSKPPDQRRRVFIHGEMPVRLFPTRIRSRFYVPDLTIAFDVDESIIDRDNGYAIAHQGKPPALALEVASETTGARDVNIKRDEYAGFRIYEYWRTDPSGGEWHGGVPLAGDRLGPDGRYVPIPIDQIGDDVLRGYSEALDLYVCWEYGALRFFDHVEGRYLLTHSEEREGRLAETARADAAEARARRLEDQLRRLQG